MRKFLLTVALGLGMAWAAQAAVRVVEVLDASGHVVATGTLSGHLSVSGDLGAAQTVRVSTTVDGVTTVKTFTLAGAITARDPEAERLGVTVDGRVLPLAAAVQGQGIGRGADDSADHDAGDDHGGAAGGHGADDGAGHDAGDDHGGNSGGHSSDDGAGHDAGDDHGGSGHGGGSGGHDGGGHH